MTNYKTVQVTPQEHELLMQVRSRLMERGIPSALTAEKSIDEILEDLKRSTFAKGAIVGLGLAALWYLLTEEE